MALFRALESQRLETTRLFRDDYAVDFLPPSFQALVRLSRLPPLGLLIASLIDLRAPGARASGIARTRLIDDLLLEALGDRVSQLIILGAGFDCRALRLPDIDKTTVFELDHPDTLRVKKDRLLRRLGSLPRHVQFIEVDFNRQQTQQALQQSTFDWARPAFVIWEGVTNYLSEAAIEGTFKLIARMSAGTRIVFTYVHLAAVHGRAGLRGLKRLNRRLLRMGEPWTFGFDPQELPAYLEARGLQLIDDIGSTDYRRRYLRSSRRNMTGYEFYRAAVARVIPKMGEAGQPPSSPPSRLEMEGRHAESEQSPFGVTQASDH